MAKGDLSVIVDGRETRANIPGLFEQHPDVGSVYTEMLETGDIIIEGEVVFERKDVGDFVQSIKNRRLENQIQSMYDLFGPEKSYVIVEGNMDDFEDFRYSQFSPESARGYVGSLSARWQCVPLFTSSRWNLVDMVTRVSRKHFESTSRVVRDPTNSPSKSNDDFFARTVLQLSGVGKSKIDPLRERYDSVRELSKASPNELQSIDGIGSKTAESIIDQFGGSVDD